MRLSQYPINTVKETPAEAEVASHQLMLRAGLIRRLIRSRARAYLLIAPVRRGSSRAILPPRASSARAECPWTSQLTADRADGHSIHHGRRMPVNEDAEIVAEFLVESHENLDQLDRDLVELEQTPGSRELLSSIFRTIHTIKGTSGFLAFGRLERLTHVGENLLSRLRDGKMTMDSDVAGVLLSMVDTVRALLESIESTGGKRGALAAAAPGCGA